MRKKIRHLGTKCSWAHICSFDHLPSSHFKQFHLFKSESCALPTSRQMFVLLLCSSPLLCALSLSLSLFPPGDFPSPPSSLPRPSPKIWGNKREEEGRGTEAVKRGWVQGRSEAEGGGRRILMPRPQKNLPTIHATG